MIEDFGVTHGKCSDILKIYMWVGDFNVLIQLQIKSITCEKTPFPWNIIFSFLDGRRDWPDVREDQGGGNSGSTGSEASCKKPKDAVFFNGFFHTLPYNTQSETDSATEAPAPAKSTSGR